MKSFIFTIHTGKPTRNTGTTTKTVRIYRILRGKPVQVRVMSENFVSDFQLCMMALEAGKLLPKAAFAVHEFAGSHKYVAPYLLEEAGFARITQVY